MDSFSFFADKEEVPVLGVSVSSGSAVMSGTQVAFQVCEACLSVALASVFLDEKALCSHVQIGCFSPVPWSHPPYGRGGVHSTGCAEC